MNFKTTIALLIVLAGLGVYMYFSHPGGQGTGNPTSTPNSTATKKLIALSADDINHIVITPADGKAITFDRQGVNWQITSPALGAADNTAVSQLLSDITGLTSQGQLDASQVSSNGLDHPSFVVQLTDKNGKTAKLAVGDQSLGKTLSVLVDDKSQPDVVDASIYASLAKPASTYRKTRMIDAATESIKQIEITRGKQVLKLEKNGSNWQINAPAVMPADNSAVEDILFGITNLTANGFDDTDSPADAGLSKPRITVWFSESAPSTQPTTGPTTLPSGTTIKLGGYENVTEKNVLASVDDGPIIIVPATTIDTFRKTALDLRDKTVANVDPDRVEGFTLTVAQPPTTQPIGTLALAVPHVYAVQRRKQSALLGPALPTTGPASVPSTQPLSKWVDRTGQAVNDEQVKALLDAFHPLKAESFIAHPSPTIGTTYTLSLQVGPGAGNPPQEISLVITDPGGDAKAIGSTNGLTFELDRAIIPILATDFSSKK